ncbi:MAG: restriction endonuclease subunit S [Rikenellaceae bacterium]
MSSKKNIPAIRFAGFDGEWRTKDFSDSFNPLRNNTLSRADLNYDYGDVLNVHYGDILVKFGENIDVESSTIPYITDSIIAQKLVSNQLQNGDVIFADTAEDETAGKCSELMNINNSIVVSGLHTMPYHPISRYASGYLGYYLNCNRFHNQLMPLMQGTKVMSISKTAIQNTYIRYPEKETEQEQISSYFKNIDHLITQSTKRLEKLKNLKKAYLEKMFPRGGATTPELRFKGFSDEWKEEQLGAEHITSSYSGGTPLVGNQDYYNGDIPFIRSGEINLETTELTITSKGLNNSSAKLVNKGDILYALYGATSGEVGISNIAGAINQAVLAIITKKGYNAEFISYWLRREKANIIGTYLQGGQGNLSGAIIKQLIILFPTYKEQQEIGNFFRNIDEQIAKQTEKLDKLKNIKKACLDKMFV